MKQPDEQEEEIISDIKEVADRLLTAVYDLIDIADQIDDITLEDKVKSALRDVKNAYGILNSID